MMQSVAKARLNLPTCEQQNKPGPSCRRGRFHRPLSSRRFAFGLGLLNESSNELSQGTGVRTQGAWRERARFGLVLTLIAACFLWGGGSRLDIPGLIFLQPLSVAIAFALMLTPGPLRWERVRVPLILLCALTLTMAVQLIPLPPALWAGLPGHEQFLPFIQASATAEVWRPLSLTPDATLASLVGLAIPAAALVGFASLSEGRSRSLLTYLLIASGLSALLGIGQLIGGAQSGLYRYAITNEGAAVGLFSNRNHQAVLLAMTWPMLALWMTERGIGAGQRTLRLWIGWTGVFALVPLLTATGSRAGLVLGLGGISAAWLLLRSARGEDGKALPVPGWLRRNARLFVIVALLCIVGAAFFLSRGEAIQRLFETNVAEETRWTNLPVLLRIAQDFFPFGSGFGSFDPVFRFYEPDELLRSTYLNHAHNDFIELVITGGLFSLAAAVAFVVWVVARAFSLKQRGSGSQGSRFIYVGLVMVSLLLIASAVDYPLRTPFHAMLLAFACGWLATPRTPADQGD
jgi:O-antigen ligase